MKHSASVGRNRPALTSDPLGGRPNHMRGHAGGEPRGEGTGRSGTLYEEGQGCLLSASLVFAPAPVPRLPLPPVGPTPRRGA